METGSSVPSGYQRGIPHTRDQYLVHLCRPQPRLSSGSILVASSSMCMYSDTTKNLAPRKALLTKSRVVYLCAQELEACLDALRSPVFVLPPSRARFSFALWPKSRLYYVFGLDATTVIRCLMVASMTSRRKRAPAIRRPADCWSFRAPHFEIPHSRPVVCWLFWGMSFRVS